MYVYSCFEWTASEKDAAAFIVVWTSIIDQTNYK